MRQQVVAGVRDPDRTLEQYEDFWSLVLEDVRCSVSEEPRNLSRALHLSEAALSCRSKAKTRWLRGRRMAAVLAGRPIPPRLPFGQLRLIDRATIAHAVLGCCSQETERIVELGSGWGANLFHLWLLGGPRAAEYVALECVRFGREATELLASTEPDLRSWVAPFDYHDPDLSALKSERGTVVFSCHSIEQITYLNDALFEQLLDIPGLECVVHLEPVGWQTWARPSLRPLLRMAASLMPPRLSLEFDIFRRSRRARYNADLLDKLGELERRGAIRIEKLERHLTGVNPLNPGTLVVWRPNPGPVRAATC